jgi:hypothetical protein
VAAFDRCLESPEPDRRIAADTKLLDEAGMEGLPTTYVGGTRLLGAVSEATLRDAFDRALRGEPGRGLSAPVYIVLSGLLVGAVTWLGRSRRGTLKDGGQRRPDA